MRPRLTHICLHVENLDECLQFYTRYCGLEIIEDRSAAGAGSIYLSESGTQSEVVLQLKSGGTNLDLADGDERHFCFNVESREAVDDIVKRAGADGILMFEADEYLPGAYFCGVRDPNGNCIEFSYGQHAPPVSALA